MAIDLQKQADEDAKRLVDDYAKEPLDDSSFNYYRRVLDNGALSLLPLMREKRKYGGNEEVRAFIDRVCAAILKQTDSEEKRMELEQSVLGNALSQMELLERKGDIAAARNIEGALLQLASLSPDLMERAGRNLKGGNAQALRAIIAEARSSSAIGRPSAKDIKSPVAALAKKQRLLGKN